MKSVSIDSDLVEGSGSCWRI